MSEETKVMYLNVRKGLVSRPMFVAETEDISKIINKNPDKDWYVSLFKYNETHKKHVEEKDTVTGIKDPKTDILYFDFDSKEDINLAKQDAITAAERLLEKGIPEDSIECFFTGNKGFSVEVKLDALLSPEQFKHAVFSVAGDLESFDPVVCDPNRIVRIPNTRHQKSGLYKIPLLPEEIVNLSVEDIKDMAKKPRTIMSKGDKVKLPKELLITETPKVEKASDIILKELTFDLSSLDMKKRPKGIDEARWALMNGFFRTGDRHYAMLCLASTQKNMGYSTEHVESFLKGVAVIQSDRTGEDEFPEMEIQDIVKTVYSDNWKGGQFTVRDPQNWLAQYARKMGITVKEEAGPMRMDQIADGFAHYIKNLDKNTIKTGIESLDKAMPILIGSGVGLVAASGAGKTSFVLNVLKEQAKTGTLTVFASLDMSRYRLFQRALQNLTGLTTEEIKNTFTSGETKQLTKMIENNFRTTYFYDRTGTTMDDIRHYIQEVEQTTGEKVKLLIVDYFERVQTDVNDDTAASKKISSQFQDLILDLDLAGIMLYQPTKNSLGGGPDTEIKSYTSIKGSSFIFQSLRGIVGLSRPFYTPHTKDFDHFARFSILKNDVGELTTLDVHWDGKTGKIRELEDVERMELKELLKWKKEKMKAAEDGNGWDD